MTTAAHPDPDRMPDWHDPFSEPRTMPSGWDYTGLTGETAPPAQPTQRPAAARRRPAWPNFLRALLFHAN